MRFARRTNPKRDAEGLCKLDKENKRDREARFLKRATHGWSIAVICSRVCRMCRDVPTFSCYGEVDVPARPRSQRLVVVVVDVPRPAPACSYAEGAYGVRGRRTAPSHRNPMRLTLGSNAEEVWHA